MRRRKPSRIADLAWGAFVILLTLYVVVRVVAYVRTGVTLDEVGHVFVLGLITLLRVALLIAISSIIWVPIGILIGLRPALAEKIQPLAQFLAAFPGEPAVSGIRDRDRGAFTSIRISGCRR